MSDFLQSNDIYDKGFGIIAKIVMKDKRLSIEAKAIYSYIVSYAGAGSCAFPSVSLICDDLLISETRFYKHRSMLVEFGYLTINKEESKRGEKSRFKRNVYILNKNLVYPSFEGTQNKSTQIEGTQNDGTNNNSLKNNNSNSNNPIINNVRFEEFWNEYPKARRINKKKCLSYWKNNKLDAHADLIINNLKNQVAKQYRHTEDRYIPHAYTYLNGERWTDPIIEVKRGSQDLSGQDYENDRGFD